MATHFCINILQLMALSSLSFAHGLSPLLHVPLKFKPTWSVSGEVVRSILGEPVEIEFVQENTVLEVLQNIGAEIGTCECKLCLVSEYGEVRSGLKMRRWFKHLQYGKLTLHRKSFSFADKELICWYRDDRVCLKCLHEAGFLAKDFIDNGILLTAADFKGAGYTLEDLLHCFPAFGHPLRKHPPARKFTLFDCQLKAAGYKAKDFKNAGYSASHLSESASYCSGYSDVFDAGGDLEYVECAAFFTASELADAGYSLTDLLDALFSEQELLSAGFKAEDLSSFFRGQRDLIPGSEEDAANHQTHVEMRRLQRRCHPY